MTVVPVHTVPTLKSPNRTGPDFLDRFTRPDRLKEDLIPKNFSELFKHYYLYVVRMVSSFGIDAQESEDVAVAILTTFFEKDVLSDYNPDYRTTYKGAERKVMFRSFLTGFVSIYVRHYRDRLRIHQRREGLSVDAVVLGNGFQQLTVLDLVSPPVVETYENLAEFDLVRNIRKSIKASAPTTNVNDRIDLSLFFELVLDQVHERGEVNIEELAELFDVSKTTARNWLCRLRDHISSTVTQ